MKELRDLLNKQGFMKPKLVPQAKRLFGDELSAKHPHATFKEAVYLEIHGLEHPVCENPWCNNHTSLNTFTAGFSRFCSVKCRNQSPDGIAGARKPKSGEATKKREQTCLERYGVRHISQTQQKKEKQKETSLKRYGVDHFMKDPLRASQVSKKRVENWLPSRIEKIEGLTLLSETYINCFEDLEWQCNECDTQFWRNLRDGRIPECPNCNRARSFPEDEINTFLRELGFTTKKNDRTIIAPLEIDILIPDARIGIEFDGLWHHRNMPASYHLNKTEQMEKQGFQLIHIFEDEWKYQKEIVQSKLKHLLGLSNRRIYARNTELKEVPLCDRRDFFERTHLQGDTGATFCYGLYFGEELVMAASFKKTRFQQRDCYELIRLATELNTNVIGGASKLIKIARHNHGPLISYADRRWSTGNVYSNWNHTHNTSPGYFWCKGKVRVPRYRAMRSRLKSLPNYSDNKSQREIMEEAGWWRVFDCGHMVFEYK